MAAHVGKLENSEHTSYVSASFARRGNDLLIYGNVVYEVLPGGALRPVSMSFIHRR